MDVEWAQISKNGRIVVPVAYRKAMGLKGGELLNLSLDENGLHIQSHKQMLERAQAIVRKYVSADRFLSDELIAERRLEAKREMEDE